MIIYTIVIAEQFFIKNLFINIKSPFLLFVKKKIFFFLNQILFYFSLLIFNVNNSEIILFICMIKMKTFKRSKV